MQGMKLLTCQLSTAFWHLFFYFQIFSSASYFHEFSDIQLSE